MSGHLSDRQMIEFALKTERDGKAFYDQASTRTSHRLAGAAFALLAREELRHASLIESLARATPSRAGTAEIDAQRRESLERDIRTIYESVTDDQAGGDLDAAEAYSEAIDLERRVSALYYRYAQECESDHARSLFDALYREEQDHLSLLEDMLAYLTKPEEWFIDRDMTLLDGG